MGKEAKKRRREEAEAALRAGAPAPAATGKKDGKKASKKGAADVTAQADLPISLAAYAHATSITGAKKVKKKCCRSTPRCKGCPVLLMRAARLQEAGLTGKDLKKALKKARAA